MAFDTHTQSTYFVNVLHGNQDITEAQKHIA